MSSQFGSNYLHIPLERLILIKEKWYSISSLHQTKALKKLDLVHNELDALPKQMGELRKLDYLAVQHNNIRELPDFTGCAAMKEIHFSNNFVTEIAGDFCENLPQLQVLDLRDNKIEKLPDEINMLQSLMRLDLTNNSILTLPVSLCTLAHLVSLQLEGNPLRSIRRDIIQSGTTRILKTLRDRAGHGDSKSGAAPPTIKEDSLYPDIYKMRKTHTLSLGMKGLAEVDAKVFAEAREAEVNVVDLSKNQLKGLPEGLAQLNCLLRELDASANQISQIPSLISQFDRLVYLNLAKNQLSDLPREFQLLVTLRELNLNNNSFLKIPCLSACVNLEILLMADNQVVEIDVTERGLGQLKRLHTLDLSNNNIDNVPPLLGNMKQIRALELNGNKFRQPRHQILAKGTDSIMSYLRDRIPNA